MTCRTLTLHSEQEWPKLAQWLQGRHNPGDGVESAVGDIIAAVRAKGDEALVEYTRNFDCPDFAPPLRVSEQEIARAAAAVPAEDREVISQAAIHIRAFHEAQLEKSLRQQESEAARLRQLIEQSRFSQLWIGPLILRLENDEGV